MTRIDITDYPELQGRGVEYAEASGVTSEQEAQEMAAILADRIDEHDTSNDET